MQGIDLTAISTETITLPIDQKKNIETSILRLDKIHPFISGNKSFKLRYYLEEAKRLRKGTILTFGGAWSNHILATAAACKLEQFKSTGIIRGEEPPVYSLVLKQALEMGMKLCFISRDDFSKQKVPVELVNDDSYLIPQGGFGPLGAKGAADILNYTDKEKYSHICCAAGTGTMMSGLIMAASSSQKIVGVSVLKNNLQLQEHIRELTGEARNNYDIVHEYHLGGYAKHNEELIDFMNEFYRKTIVPTDIVYTGKLCFAIANLIQKNFFPQGSRVLIIHSGGLTGNASLEKGTLIF
ncbi:MAG TPA: pyridoxal-phosphate dependent enzyme [Chitinophagaceae bacterium]|nr:pyridoxal-phosphate dependent enzyme [Chitinophagaceae bacterium]